MGFKTSREKAISKQSLEHKIKYELENKGQSPPNLLSPGTCVCMHVCKIHVHTSS